jgi:hypothetical protein
VVSNSATVVMMLPMATSVIELAGGGAGGAGEAGEAGEARGRNFSIALLLGIAMPETSAAPVPSSARRPTRSSPARAVNTQPMKSTTPACSPCRRIESLMNQPIWS